MIRVKIAAVAMALLTVLSVPLSAPPAVAAAAPPATTAAPAPVALSDKQIFRISLRLAWNSLTGAQRTQICVVYAISPTTVINKLATSDGLNLTRAWMRSEVRKFMNRVC